MRRSRFTEEQIVGIRKEQVAGMPTAELCRRHGISDQTLSPGKKKYGGLDLSDARSLKQLADENARLKRLVADQALANVMLGELLRRNCSGPRRDARRCSSCKNASRCRSGGLVTRGSPEQR